MNEKKAIDFRWDDIPLFLAVARMGGLSAASRVTKASPATIGRRMIELERSLGRELFVRHDRGYNLTIEGRNLLKNLSDFEGDLYKMIDPDGTTSRLKPIVKVSAGSWTTLFLLERLNDLTGMPRRFV